MELDRETTVEIVAAAVPVLFLLAAMVFIGRSYATDGSLSATGGKVLVVVIVAFVALLAALGVWLSRTDY
jgi:hypothetical protein